MLESLLQWLTIAFVVVAVLSFAGFFIARWMFVRSAERMADTIDRRVGGAAAGALTRLSAYARATGIDLPEAERRFGLHIERFATLMDSAVRIPILGSVGLDALISLVPVVGDLAAGALSLTLVVRSLRYGPPAALVSKMLANVLTDLILGAIPFVGVLADIWFKANERNARLMREYLGEDGRRRTENGARGAAACRASRRTELQYFEADAHAAASEEAEAPRGSARDVDDHPLRLDALRRSAVEDPHGETAAVLEVGDAHHRAKGIARVGGDECVHVEARAARRRAALKARPVVGREPLADLDDRAGA